MKTNCLTQALAGACFVLATSGAHAAPESFPDALVQGKVSLSIRARYEGVDQTGMNRADAVTLRTRLGYATAPFRGVKALVEFENTASPDGDRYSQAGLNPGGAGRAAVADPEGSEVNQAWLAYTAGTATFTAGRQRLVFDNARFVGDVGWRQNMQTFDGAALTGKAAGKINLNYGYLARINRVFGGRHPLGRWHSDSHVFNASYAGLPAGTLTAYAYLLDFDDAVTQSCATYGLSVAGSRALNGAVKFAYRVEAATQRDHGSSPFSYTASYWAAEIGLARGPATLAVGFEELGSDEGTSFRTPLATLHAFNGWADAFLVTPANGLRDTYVKASAGLPAGVGLLAFYHVFEGDRLGARYGTEFDVQLTRKFGPLLTAIVKYADFQRDNAAFADVRKLWVQLELAY